MDQDQQLGLVAVTYWTIWNDRNKFAHNEDIIPPINLRSQWIIKNLESFLKANEKRPSTSLFNQREDHTSTNPIACCNPPPARFWKLNTDTTCAPSSPLTGLGMTCRNEKGKIIFSLMACVDFHMNTHLVELNAIFEGIKKARSGIGMH